MSNVVTYTAVFGNYDTLQPAKHSSLCFMDGLMGTVEGWEYRTVFAGRDPKWANRHCKILAHEHLDTEYSIYHDGNIQMLIDPREAIARWLKGVDIAVFAHPDRCCVYDEAEACIAQGKATAAAVNAQMVRYRQEKYPARNGLAACWVVIRRHTEAIKRLNELWWAEYNKGAKRDQLSFNYVCRKLGVRYGIIPGNLFKGASEAFKRVRHKRSPVVHVDWRTAYGAVLLPAERQWLKDTAAQFKGRATIVNIGVFRCASMYCLRAGASQARLVGVDVKRCDVPIGDNLKAEFIIADSGKCHVQFKSAIHFLVIDGDHRYGGVKADLAGWTPKVVPGGIVVLHDYAPQPKHLALLPELEGVRRAVSEWAERVKWQRLQAPDSLVAFRRPG